MIEQSQVDTMLFSDHSLNSTNMTLGHTKVPKSQSHQGSATSLCPEKSRFG
ncbi:uncharacterized protein METZ01_LOCUS327750, partial [marine metagenome]